MLLRGLVGVKCRLSIVHCEWVEALLAPLELDVILTYDFLEHKVNTDFVASEMEEVRLLSNILLESMVLLGQDIVV